MMASQRIPTPTISLIDFNLVQDLGLKLSDIQCSKFTFAGNKLRILGKISQTVQCVKNGTLAGNIHIKANVVENLASTFDTHSIASGKMTKLLSTPESDNIKEKVSIKTRKSSCGSSCSSQSTPRSPSSTPTKLRSPSTPSSPPGFPCVPQYAVDVDHQEPPVLLHKPSPGYVRRLQLRPENAKDRYWAHGRVVDVPRRGVARVDCLRQKGDPYGYEGSVFSATCHHPCLSVSVNDAVLYLQDTTPGRSYDELQPHIRVVYTEQEVQKLQNFGVKFPECPPEMLPNGYYG